MDYSNISIVAKKQADEIWEGSIDGKTEDIIGEEGKYCLRTLLRGFLEHKAEQAECEESPYIIYWLKILNLNLIIIRTMGSWP